jgi:YidC/Oxa1 family membrane protein insertase
MNLLCSALNAGKPDATLTDTKTKIAYPVDCGSKAIDRVPYYVFAVLMFGTTYFQQRQMQKASPPGAASQQQQTLLKIMPIMFGVFGIFFPAGLVLYWTTSNAWQIGQQYFMLKTRPTAETLAARAAENQKSQKKGFMSSMMDRADEQRKRREQGQGRTPTQQRKPGSQPPRKPGSQPPRKPNSQQRKPGAERKPGTGKPKPGSPPRGSGSTEQPPEAEGTDGRDPGDRPER